MRRRNGRRINGVEASRSALGEMMQQFGDLTGEIPRRWVGAHQAMAARFWPEPGRRGLQGSGPLLRSSEPLKPCRKAPRWAGRSRSSSGAGGRGVSRVRVTVSAPKDRWE